MPSDTTPEPMTFGPHASELLRGFDLLDLVRPEVQAIVRARAKVIAARRLVGGER